MVELPAPDPPADVGDVLAEERPGQRLDEQSVTQHENDLFLAPGADAVEALGEQERGRDGCHPQDEIRAVIDDERARVASDEQQVEIGVDTPEAPEATEDR